MESDADVVIDVIASTGSNLQRVNASEFRSLAMGYRYLEISSYYTSMNGLERAKFSHPNVTYRYVVLPSTPLPTNYFPLSMNQTQVQEIYDRGVQDGQNARVGMIDDHLAAYRMKRADKSAAKASPQVEAETSFLSS